jgi:outer membrane receptor protein involved in Fe transport
VDPFIPQFVPGLRPIEREPLHGFPQDVSGNRMNKAPRYNLAVGLQYDLHTSRLGLPDWGTFTPRVQLQYQSQTFYRPWNRQEFSQRWFSKLDVRLGWRSRSGRWSLDGFVNNVTDVDVINYLQVGAISDGTIFGFYQLPRTAGIRIGLQY